MARWLPANCLSPHSVYSGHQSVLVPPLELESNVSLWLSAVSQYKARVTFCSYSVMEMCTKGLGAQTGALRVSASMLGYTAMAVLPSPHTSDKLQTPWRGRSVRK